MRPRVFFFRVPAGFLAVEVPFRFPDFGGAPVRPVRPEADELPVRDAGLFADERAGAFLAAGLDAPVWEEEGLLLLSRLSCAIVKDQSFLLVGFHSLFMTGKPRWFFSEKVGFLPFRQPFIGIEAKDDFIVTS